MKKLTIGTMVLTILVSAYFLIFDTSKEEVVDNTALNVFDFESAEEANEYLEAMLSGAYVTTGDTTVEGTGFDIPSVELVEDTIPTASLIVKDIPAYSGKLDMENTLSARLQDYNVATIEAKFSDDFINNYKYEDSDKFFFGLKVFVGNHTDNGGYYNALRTRSLSVANWNYLTGVVMASQLKDGFTWTIPLNEDIYLANSEFVEGRQVIKTNLSQYFNEVGDTKIGAYLSSTKELKGWELGDIKITLSK